jgi:hypothetical protein
MICGFRNCNNIAERRNKIILTVKILFCWLLENPDCRQGGQRHESRFWRENEKPDHMGHFPVDPNAASSAARAALAAPRISAFVM